MFCPQGSHVLPQWLQCRVGCRFPQVLKDLTAKSNVQIGLNFPRALKNLVILILEGKVPSEFRSYFFGAKLIALKKPDGRLRPIAVGNTFRRLSANCAGYHVL